MPQFVPGAIHDFIALVVSLAIGVVASYWAPLWASASLAVFSFGAWLLLTGPLARAGRGRFVDRRVARAGAGAALALLSEPAFLASLALDARTIALLFLFSAALLAVYVYLVSRASSGAWS
ncbi:MAG: hypothetical protein ABWK00_06125 [Desulfurococcaceae archaeon]